MKKIKLFLILGIALLAVGLYSCGTKKDEKKLTGIEITTMPTKVEYVEGETFDKSGMVVSYVYSDKTKEATTDYTVDKTAPLTVADTEVTVTAKTYTAKVSIKVTKATIATPTLTDVEVKVKDGALYMRTLGVAESIMYREAYSDGTFGEWGTCVEEDILSKSIVDGKLKVEVSLFIQNKEYKKEVTLEISDDAISVSELLTKEVNETVHMINGVLVGIASTNSHVEYLLMDKLNHQIIGVEGLDGGGKINDYALETNGFEIGDELIIPVKLTKVEQAAGLSDSNKVYAIYQGGTDYATAVVSKNNDLRVDKETAVEISSQEELVNFLSSENRSENFYQVVKLHGKLNYIYYANSKQYRFFFDGVTSLAGQKIDNCSPTFASGSSHYTVGKSIGELLFDQDEFAPTEWANPASLVKDIYAVFMGGNSFYHAFVILNANDIEDITPTFINYTLQEPTNLTYTKGQEFSLEGGAVVANYDYGAPVLTPLTLDMLTSTPDMNQVGKQIVTGTYDGYNFQFEITIIDKVVEKVELNEQLPSNRISFRAGYESVVTELCKLQLKATYTDGTTELIDIAENMISCDATWEIGTIAVNVSYMAKSVTIDIEVYLEVTNVEDAKTKTASQDVYYDLTGIIIGQGYVSGTVAAPQNGEILIKDLNSNAIIGVRGLITDSVNLASLSLAIGDEIIVRVSLVKYTANANYSEYGKLYASAVLDETVIVVSHNNETALNKEEAVNILCQEDLNNFLKDAETRSANAYKLVKFGAGLSIANYKLDTNSSYLTYTGISSATSKIDGLNPYIHEMNEAINLGSATYLSAIFGPDATRNVNFGLNGEVAGNVTSKDLYLVYIGGQGKYYHQFVLLDASYVSDTASKNLKEIEFTQPTKQVYEIGEELDLTGGKIEYVYYYAAQNETVELKDVIGEYDMSTAGTKTITFTVGEKQFSYEIIIVSGAPTSIEIETMPTVLKYTPHTTLSEIDLTGGMLNVIYGTTGSVSVPMEKATITTKGDEQPYYLGEVTFVLTYNGTSCEITLTFEALTISELLTQTVGETYEVTGVVVGPVSSQGGIELLIKEKNSDVTVGIVNTGLTGTTQAPTLDTTVVNVGDEIIVVVKLTKGTTEKHGDLGKVYANGVDADTFKANLAIVSSGNDATINTEAATVITTQEELIAFLNSSDRFYKVVKLVGVKAIYYASGESKFYRLFFGEEVTKLAEQKVNEVSPVFNHNIANYYLTSDITTYFTNPTSKSYSAPAVSTHDFYALFAGGNGYYHAFIPLGDSWVVER